MKGKKMRLGMMGILALFFAVNLAGCASGMSGNVESTGEAVIEKGTIVLQEEEVPELPVLRETDLITGDGADNPAGLLQETCANAMVKVQAGSLSGSGVIVASDRKYLWIATAGHVLDRTDAAVKITFADGLETETVKLQRAENQDLAILRVSRIALVEKDGDREDDHGLEYRRAILDQDAFDAMKDGDLAIAMGSRNGAGEDAYAGVISQDYVYLEDFGAHMIVAQVQVTPGMSGGGLFDSKGRLLGILCGVSEDGEVAVCPVLNVMAMELK